MKYLIAGLGNPGKDYQHTRHNIGFALIDTIAAHYEATFTKARLAYQAYFKEAARHIYLIKPITYMNQSGQAIAYWLHKLKLTPDKLLVLVDDLALPFGVTRLRFKGGDGGHNGLKSIANHLQTSAYARFRFGISAHFARGQQAAYVLAPFTQSESETLPMHLQTATDAIATFWRPR